MTAVVSVKTRGLKYTVRRQNVARLMYLYGTRLHQNHLNYICIVGLIWSEDTLYLLLRPARSFFVKMRPLQRSESETSGLDDTLISYYQRLLISTNFFKVLTCGKSNLNLAKTYRKILP